MHPSKKMIIIVNIQHRTLHYKYKTQLRLGCEQTMQIDKCYEWITC